MSSLKLSTGKSSPGQTSIMLGILCMFAGVLVSYLYLVPNLQKSYAQVENDSATLKDVTAAVATLNSDKLKLAKAQNALDLKGVTKDFLVKVVPQTEELPSVYLQMENVVATATKIVGLTYQVGAPISDSKLGVKIPLQFSAKGSYANLKDLLTKLENLERPVTVTTIAFSSSTKSEEVGFLILTASGFLRAHALSDAYATTPSH